MDQKTQDRINELVAEFQKAKTPFDRQQITKTAQRDLQFVSGALREFVDRASIFGEVQLIGDVLGSYEQQQEQGTASSANADAIVDELLERYRQATTTSERNEVVLEATERLRGFPIQQNKFSFQIERADDVLGEASGTPAPTTTVPEETERQPVAAPQMPVEPPAPTGSATLGGLSSNERILSSLEMSPGQISQEFAQQQRNPVAAAETRRAQELDTRSEQEIESYYMDRFGGDPEKIRAAFQESMRERILLQRLGITGDDALRILSYYRNSPDKDLISDIQTFRSAGGTEQDARDYFFDMSQGIARDIRAEQLPLSAIPRLVQRVDADGNPVGEPTKSQTPGIVQASDLTIKLNADGSPYVYPASMPSLYLQELSVSGLASFKERLFEYFGANLNNPQEVEYYTQQILADANEKGIDIQLLFNEYDRQAGVQLDATGRRQPRLTGPIDYTPSDQVVAVIEQVAAQELGRELSDQEKWAIVNEYKNVERDFAFDRRRAEIKAASGASVMSPSAPMSLDTVAEQWLQENRPEQMKVASQMPAYSRLFEMWQNGDFNVEQ